MRSFSIATCFVALAYSSNVFAAANLIKIGVLSYRGDDHAVATWKSTADYLTQTLPEYRFQVLPHSRVQLTKAVEAGMVDFVITHPLHYVQLAREGDFGAIATIKREYSGHVFSDYAAVIFSRKETPQITTLDDLENKAMAGAQQDGFGALQIAWIEMQMHGVDPFQDLTRTHVTAFSVTDVLAAVRSRIVDVGVMRADTYNRLINANQIGKNEFNIVNAKQSSDYPFIFSTRLYPEWPFVRITENESLSERVASALVEMPLENIAAQAAQIEGWVPAVNYSTVQSIDRNLGIGDSSHRNIWLWRQYWWMFLLMFGSIAAMFWYGTKLRERAKKIEHEKHSIESSLETHKDNFDRTKQDFDRAYATLAAVDVAVLRVAANGNVEYLNDAARRMLRLPMQSETLPSLASELIFTVNGRSFSLSDLVVAALSEQKPLRLQKNVKIKYAAILEINAVELNLAQIQEANYSGCVLTLRDVSAERETERRIRHLANHDSLTGLLNRAEFERQLSQSINAAQQNRATPVMLYLDLDQFKQVNDVAGHNAGDELLKQLTTELNGLIETDQCLARLGGDEFGLLLPNSDVDKASQIAERLRGHIANFHFAWNNRSFGIGVSIGIVAINQRMHSVTEVLQAADKACFAAKEAGRNRVHVYLSDNSEIVQHGTELNWSNRIAQALKKGRFALDAQIIQSYGSNQSKALRFEVLVRLLDEQGNRILPKYFMSSAERFKQSVAIDRWVIERALYNLNEHELRYSDQVSCHINISAQTIADSQFLQFMIDCFEIYDISPSCITFELSESAAIANAHRTRHLIGVLRGMGCEFAIDSFGSNLSSIRHLKTMGVDYMKIDGALIRSAASDKVSEAMVHSFEQIAHTMKLSVVATGIESEETLDAIKRTPFDYIQGYHVVPVQPLLSILSHQRAVAI